MATIEKEKAIDVVRQMVADGQVSQEVAEKYFPKLKSEDERIRKWCISHFKECINVIKDNNEYKEYLSNKVIAWLEKIGKNTTNKGESNLLTHERAMEISPFMRSGFENEDKVEPKFHKEDWVVWDNKISCHVDNIYQGKNSLMYTITDTNNMTRSYSVKGFDNNAHLWTINDAKDGDVIYSRHNTESFEWIGIFKSLDKEYKRVFFYGFWHDMAKTFSVCGKEAYVLYDDFSPATDEQRNQLKKAMADAGYTFDFENKELKKVEQKSSECIQETIPNGGIVWEDFNEGDGNYKVNLAYLSKSQVELIENLVASWQNPTNNTTAWSEEDETRLTNIIIMLKEGASHHFIKDDITKAVDWLKSLKDRYTWKPSDEQMKVLENVRKILHTNDIYSKENHLMYNFEELIRTLNKLRGK